MSDENPTTCSICKKPKTELVERTEIGHEPIYVCTTKSGKRNMPCDGYLFKIASKRL